MEYLSKEVEFLGDILAHVEATGEIIDTGFPHYEGAEVIIKEMIDPNNNHWVGEKLVGQKAVLLTHHAKRNMHKEIEKGDVLRVMGFIRKRGESVQIIPQDINDEMFNNPFYIDMNVFGPVSRWGKSKNRR